MAIGPSKGLPLIFEGGAAREQKSMAKLRILGGQPYETANSVYLGGFSFLCFTLLGPG
jgi:hypothetical protein